MRTAGILPQPPSLLNDLCDGSRGVVDVVRVESSDADAPSLDGVDGEFFAQSPDLFLGEAGVGEHAPLLQDEAEIRARRAVLDVADEIQPHALDAFTHGAKLLLPKRAQFRRAEHGGDELAAM